MGQKRMIESSLSQNRMKIASLAAVCCAAPVVVDSFSYSGTLLQVAVVVQNLAFNKQVEIVYCDTTNACQNTFPCSYGSQNSQQFETWRCSQANFPKGIRSFTVKYQVAGSTYFDNGPDGKGYIVATPTPTQSSTIIATSTTVNGTLPTPSPFADTKIILQAFDWDSISNGNRVNHFNFLSSQVEEFRGAGFDAAWLPPHTESVDFQGYFPTKWYSNINDQAVRTAVSKLKSVGIIPMVDLVVNHRGGWRSIVYWWLG
jgi:hypothetical protein